MDPGLFRDRVFTLGMLAAFLSTPRLSLMVVAALYFQGLHGASPLEAATGVTVVAVGLTAGSLLADPLSRWTGERALTIGAVLGSLVGLVELVWAVEHGGAATALVDSTHHVSGTKSVKFVVPGQADSAFIALRAVKP